MTLPTTSGSLYGEHLRAVLEDFHKNAPLSEHRAACKCKRCIKAAA